MSKRLSILLVLMTVLYLTPAACGNSDDGPVAVVEELFQRLENHGFTEIAELVCAASRDDVAELFGLGEFLDVASGAGIGPQQAADLFIFEPSLTFQEVNESGDDATVRVRGSLKVTVDAAKFKTLARQILEDQGAPDEERTDSALDQLYVDFAEDFEQELSERVDVDLGLIKEDGKWLVCHWGPPDRSAPTATPSRQVNLDEPFTLHSDEAVVIAGTGLILHLDMAGHEYSADHSSESVFAELTATLNGTSQRLYVDLDKATQRTVGDYTVHVLGIDGFGRGSCELRVVQQTGPMPITTPSPSPISAASITSTPVPTAPATPPEPMPTTTPSPFPISATLTPTQPTAAPSAVDWQTHSSQGFELEYPENQ